MVEFKLSEKYYTREEVFNNPRCLYIFTDNTNRTSGNNIIDPGSRYCREYGPGRKYPNKTSAIIRGLENAYPITTQHWYNSDHYGKSGRWEDSDYEEFKDVIDSDFSDITEALSTGKYDEIIFPKGGLFGSSISDITIDRVPLLYSYLLDKCTMFIKSL